MSFVYKADPDRGKTWAGIFLHRAPDLRFQSWPDVSEPEQVRYAAVWEAPADFLERFPNLQILFSVGAGIDHIDLSVVPEGIPVVRMIEPGLTQSVVEYVTWSALTLHRNVPTYLRRQKKMHWEPLRVWTATHRQIGVMGLGEIGVAALKQLKMIGFQCKGWGRSPHQIAGVDCFYGPDMLREFLSGCDMIVCLLPLTDATRGILNRDLFEQLGQGAGLIHVGRGAHLIAEDLIQALNSGHLSEAIIDVTDPEPLPVGHPLWAHPHVILTPHIAGMTQPETAATFVLDNIRRHQQGESLVGVVNRARGY